MDHNLDARAGRIARRQLGLITGGQARDIGFTRHQIDTRATTGRWTREARDVFAIAGTTRCWQRDALAACLAGPAGSTASHDTAAALWGIGRPSSRPQLTVPSSAGARLSLAKVHRSDLAPADVTLVGEIPVTRVARTLIDLAATWNEHALEQALDGGRTTAVQIEAAVGRVPRGRKRAGVSALCRLLEAWTGPIQPESPAEARLVRRLGSWGLAPPVLQHVVHDLRGVPIARIDVAWPAHRVGLEYEGRRPHGPRRVEHDELRQGAVEALGWTLESVSRIDLRPGETRLRDLLVQLVGLAA